MEGSASVVVDCAMWEECQASMCQGTVSTDMYKCCENYICVCMCENLIHVLPKI